MKNGAWEYVVFFFHCYHCEINIAKVLVLYQAWFVLFVCHQQQKIDEFIVCTLYCIIVSLTLLAPISRNGQTHSKIADELFECVLPFCEIGV